MNFFNSNKFPTYLLKPEGVLICEIFSIKSSLKDFIRANLVPFEVFFASCDICKKFDSLLTELRNLDSLLLSLRELCSKNEKRNNNFFNQIHLLRMFSHFYHSSFMYFNKEPSLKYFIKKIVHNYSNGLYL
jgi:hypothetical protein